MSSITIINAYYLPIDILGFLFIYLQRLYLACDRQLKRLDHESKSSLYIHLAESTLGASTIRAYHKQHWFNGEYLERLNDVQRVHFASVACNRWLAVRIEILGSMVMFAAAILAVIAVVYVPSVDVGLVGMSLFYALDIPQSLTWALRSYCEIEVSFPLLLFSSQANDTCNSCTMNHLKGYKRYFTTMTMGNKANDMSCSIQNCRQKDLMIQE